MQFRLYYAMHADPDPITQVRIFISREAALDYALRLYCDGYELYVLEGDNGETLDAAEILEIARSRPTVH
jgi:hypothetical protein